MKTLFKPLFNFADVVAIILLSSWADEIELSSYTFLSQVGIVAGFLALYYVLLRGNYQRQRKYWMPAEPRPLSEKER